MLEIRELSVRFGGHTAVDNASCSFRAGTLTAIVGPNGAGKTTLFNLISGQIKASTGSVWLQGRDLTALSASARSRRGLGRAFQLTQLFPALSVQENVRLAAQARVRRMDLHHIWSDRQDWLAEADAVLDDVGLNSRRNTVAGNLPHGDQRKLEVAVLMALQPKVYMFDEPTAGMSVDDAPAVLQLIRKVKAKADRVVLLVEHKMDVVRELADRLVVLNNGALVADGTPSTVIASDVVQQAYLGQGTPKETP